MLVFHWAAGWNVLKTCRQGLVDRGILDGEPDFRFASSVDVLPAKPAKSLSVSGEKCELLAEKFPRFPQIGLCGALLFSGGQIPLTERRRLIRG